MNAIKHDLSLDGTPLVRLENDFVTVDVAPDVGGRIVSIVDKATGYEFLWRNRAVRLERLPAGSPYDPNFYGGIDDLLPCDMAERIDGVDCPDHGELWTEPLAAEVVDGALVLSGEIPLFGLTYRRRMELRQDSPHLDMDYRIENVSGAPRHYLWRLHPALNISVGDVLECPARTGQVRVVDSTRWASDEPFQWPVLNGERIDVLGEPDGTNGCVFLYDMERGHLALRKADTGLAFALEFDTRVFPYVCSFVSFGGFEGHYTIIPEPSSAMPVSVNKAMELNQCPVLRPGVNLETHITLYAGR